MDKKNIIIE